MRVLVLGSTGRLGRAVVAALPGHAVTGLARHAPAQIQADRKDLARLATLLADADAVIDLCGFTPDDAEVLVQAAGKTLRRLIFASSLAALQRPDAPMDDYGRGKATMARTYRDHWPGPVTTLLLPQLIARDAHARERVYLDDARTLGHAQLPAPGMQKPALAQVEVVADLIARLLDLDTPPAELPVAHPDPQPVRALVLALLQGAGLPGQTVVHPDPRWRGPHAGADEPVDPMPLRALVPTLHWPALIETYTSLGAWLAAQPTL
jgi:nucleoside-diphosphate-sugar epimerase